MNDDSYWPDPRAWVERLNEKLVHLDLAYYGISQLRQMRADPDEVDNLELINGDLQANATLTATAAFAAVITALKEIPTFSGNVGLTALTDLGHALQDLDRGLRPPMLQPRSDTKVLGDGSGRQFVKAHVLLCVELLEVAGVKNSRARGDIAVIFSAQGFRGRKGGALSAQSLYEWQTSVAAQGGDQRTREIINTAIADWKQKRGWPPLVPDVLDYASNLAKDPALRVKI
jgi:hypothetical protein